MSVMLTTESTSDLLLTVAEQIAALSSQHPHAGIRVVISTLTVNNPDTDERVGELIIIDGPPIQNRLHLVG